MAAWLSYRASPEGTGDLFPDEPYSLRPIVDAVVTSQGGAVSGDFLLDSGCPYNIMSSPFARRLGLTTRPRGTLRIGGRTLPVRVAEVSLVLESHDPVDALMGFVQPWEWPFAGILGQRGFFDQFIVTFDRANERFRIEDS